MTRLLTFFRLTLLFTFVFVTRLDFSDLSDPERRKEAIAQMVKVLSDASVEVPSWLAPHIELFLGAVVDTVVFFLKRTGVLGSGSVGSED